MTIPFILTYLTSWLIVSGGVYGLFNKAGESLNPETQKSISRWLTSIKIETPHFTWSTVFIELFDRVFGKKHWSIKCFIRSTITSIFGVIFIWSVSSRTYNYDIYSLFNAIVLGLFLNIIPDYLSLLETRWLLGQIKNSRFLLASMAWLIIDIIVTYIIFLVSWFILNLLFSGSPGDALESTLSLFVDTRGLLLFNSPNDVNPLFGIFIYTTFLTSVWIWLYLFSGVLIKMVSISANALRFLQKHLDIKERPFNALGYLLIVLTTIVYIIWGVFILFDKA